MGFKHQTESYRNRNGVKYKSLGDYENRESAKNALAVIRKDTNLKCFLVHMNDGCSRLFVEDSEFNKKVVLE